MKRHDFRGYTIAVAAGKGGTGKTLLATSLSLMLQKVYPGRVQLLDCDVEEPNAHLLLHPTLTEEQEVSVPVPQVDLEKCTRCGRCAAACQNSAIAVIRQAVLTLPRLCSGCGACSYVCPESAITEVPRRLGAISRGTTAEDIDFHVGRLDVGEVKATPLTRALKRRVRAGDISIIDAPPGTACPMQEAAAGTDYCLLVTEPTPFGLSDLRMAVATCQSVGVPYGVVINRHGSGFDGVEQYLRAEGIDLLGLIPQQRRIAEAYSAGIPLLAREPRWQRVLLDVATTMFRRINEKR